MKNRLHIIDSINNLCNHSILGFGVLFFYCMYAYDMFVQVFMSWSVCGGQRTAFGP